MSKRRTGLPEGWQLRSMRDVVEIENRAVRPVPGKVYRYLELEQVQQQTGVILNAPETDGALIRSTKYGFDSTHVLYSKLRPNLNKVAMPSFSGVCSTDLLPLAAKPGLLREYLAFFLRTSGFVSWAVTHATGTKMPRIGIAQFLNAAIPLPPLPVQERIVHILRKADEVRDKRQNALDLAGSILSSSFIAMFGNPIDNGSVFPRRALGSFANVKSGVTKGRKLQGKATVEVPYLRVANIQDGFLDLDEVKTIDVLMSDCEKYHLEDGDILMTEGGDPDKLGRGCIWHEEVKDCIHQNHVFRVRTDRNVILPEYLAALLRSQYAKQYFLSCAKRSSNLASVNSKQVKAFPVPVPSLSLQEKFLMAVRQWEETADRLKTAQKRAENTFRSLLHHAFSGELTATFEQVNAQQIQALQTFQMQLPRILTLNVLSRTAERSSEAPAEPGLLVTAMMKLIFLIQMKGATKRRFYQFIPYHYGPFAKELYADLEKLQADGVVRIDNGDEDKTRITLVDSARAAELAGQLPEELREDVQAVVDGYGGLGHNALLKRVYEEFPTYARKSRLRRTAAKKAKGQGAGG